MPYTRDDIETALAAVWRFSLHMNLISILAVLFVQADRMVISSLTAKTHINRAMAKLGAHARAQLVILAYETGLVRPSGRAAQ